MLRTLRALFEEYKGGEISTTRCSSTDSVHPHILNSFGHGQNFFFNLILLSIKFTLFEVDCSLYGFDFNIYYFSRSAEMSGVFTVVNAQIRLEIH